jgi:hypothetical protein
MPGRRHRAYGRNVRDRCQIGCSVPAACYYGNVPPLSRSLLATCSKIALAIFWLGLFIGTHVPVEVEKLAPETSDKLIHALAYAGLSFLLATTWELAVGRLSVRHLTLAWFAVVLFAAFDEVTQIPVGRVCDFRDWLADTVGAAIGLSLFVALYRVLSDRIRMQ